MSYIVLCNTGSDMLSKIDTESLNVKNFLLSNQDTPAGPHELSSYKDNILVANNYNNSISVINKSEFEEDDEENKRKNINNVNWGNNRFKKEKNLYIGSHPNDVAQYNNIAYVTCGEANSLIVYDLENEKMNFNLPVGRFPHNISICKNKKLAFISNMGDDSISVIDIELNKEVKRITVENTPIKINLSNNNHYLYVCMSYLGYDKEGYIGVISLKSLELINKVKVGFSPVDIFEDNNYLYVSNFCGRSVSIINIKELREETKIDVGGMPRGIIKHNDKIFIGDYLNGIVDVINLKTKEVKAIAVGKEPNAMTFIK